MKIKVCIKLTEEVIVDIEDGTDIDDYVCELAHNYPNFSGSIMDVDYEVLDV